MPFKKQDELTKAAIRDIKLCSTKSDVQLKAQVHASQMMVANLDNEQLDIVSQEAIRRMAEIDQLQASDAPPAFIDRGHYLPPTPPLGFRVIWWQNNNADSRYCADIVQIEGPGRLQLKIHKPKGDAHTVPDHVLGVYHRSDPRHERQHSPETVRSGAWDYLDGAKPHEAHYALAKADLDRKEGNARREAARRAEIEKSIQEQEKLAQEKEPQAV